MRIFSIRINRRNAFLDICVQYYTMLAKEPKYLHRFYGSNSEMLHGAKEEQLPAVGQVKIREKIKALCFRDCHTKVAQLDAFITIGNGIVIQVAGEISNNQQPLRRFMQTFVLGPQDREGKRQQKILQFYAPFFLSID